MFLVAAKSSGLKYCMLQLDKTISTTASVSANGSNVGMSLPENMALIVVTFFPGHSPGTWCNPLFVQFVVRVWASSDVVQVQV
jgi:hypothetical protein